MPEKRALTLGNVFLQDTIALSTALSATAGIKLEDDPYSGWSALPDARIAWRLNASNQLWAAASKAIRSPTPSDVDVRELLAPGGEVGLSGNQDFRPEKVWAYEIGYRAQPLTRLPLSISAFYNLYDDLRTIEPAAGTFFPLRWCNLMAGDTYGFELWGDYQLTDWWRLSPGFSTVRHQPAEHAALRIPGGVQWRTDHPWREGAGPVELLMANPVLSAAPDATL